MIFDTEKWLLKLEFYNIRGHMASNIVKSKVDLQKNFYGKLSYNLMRKLLLISYMVST